MDSNLSSTARSAKAQPRLLLTNKLNQPFRVHPTNQSISQFTSTYSFSVLTPHTRAAADKKKQKTPKMSRVNHESAEAVQDHRLLHYWGNTNEEDYYAEKGMRSTKSHFTSARGFKLFTRSWQPLSSSPPRAIICMIHGYGNDISWTFQSTPIFLAQNGFACFSLDLPGHGQSEGLKAFVPNVDDVVDDCISYFNSIKQSPDFNSLPSFLYGESMGGAICLLIHFKNPNDFNGAVLVAPMCRISDDVKPRWPIPQILTFLGRFMPALPIVPTADLLDKSVKVVEKKVIAGMNPLRYTGKPRLGTVIELLRVTDYVSKRLCDVRLPFIVLHGSADVVTDPKVSQDLYDEAKSEDKTLKIYDGMLHSLLFGETDENVEIVRKDILAWLNDRCKLFI